MCMFECHMHTFMFIRNLFLLVNMEFYDAIEGPRKKQSGANHARGRYKNS